MGELSIAEVLATVTPCPVGVIVTVEAPIVCTLSTKSI